MNGRTVSLMLVVMWVSAGCASQEFRPHSGALLVESSADLPPIARTGGIDMFLHDSNDGRTYLYIESATGAELNILDVTDPASIRSVGQAPISASAPFEFVGDVNQLSALVRYRGAHGYAVLDFSQYNRPELNQTPQLAGASTAENIGTFGLLLISNGKPAAASGDNSASPRQPGRTYDVMDTSHPGTPGLLASVPGVKRRLTKEDTGTLFLLADNGVTVVRNLRAEEERALQISASRQ
jgi:hypothetical protein